MSGEDKVRIAVGAVRRFDDALREAYSHNYGTAAFRELVKDTYELAGYVEGLAHAYGIANPWERFS